MTSSAGFRLTYYRTVDATPTIVTLGSGTLSTTLSSLGTGTTYIIYMVAYTSVGDGPQSGDIATTWGGCPAVCVSVSVSACLLVRL